MNNRLKRLLAWLLSVLYRLACRLVRANRKRIAFFSYPDFSDNSRHLYRYLAGELQGYQLVWLTHSRPDAALVARITREAGSAANQVLVVKRWSLRGLAYFVSAHLAFHTHGTYFFVRQAKNRTLVNLWHGMPIKSIAYLDGQSAIQVAYSDYVIATSGHFQTIMANAFRVPLAKSLVTGLPRNDSLLHVSAERRQALFAQAGLPASGRLIVWLPTYRVSTVGALRRDAASEHFIDELPSGFLGQLDQLAVAQNVSVLIKLHPMDCLNDALPELGLQRIRLLSAAAWAAQGIELYELLACSDGLVSDVSSVIIDYLLMPKNVGVFVTSLRSYSRDTLVDLDEVRKVTLAIETPEDFLNVLSAPTIGGRDLGVFHTCLEVGDSTTACRRVAGHFISDIKK